MASAPPPTYETALLGATLSSFVYEYRGEMKLEGDVIGTLEGLMRRALVDPNSVPTIDPTTAAAIVSEKEKGWIELVEYIEPCGGAPFQDTECAVFVAHRQKLVVVAFRGTESRADWLTNAQFWHGAIGDLSDDVNSKVHKGFHIAYFCGQVKERVEAAVLKQYNRLSKAGEVWGVLTTGHSLGGALAMLCTYRLAVRDVVGLASQGVPIQMVTFGAPRVGNAAFKAELEESPARLVRVINDKDVVPRIPRRWTFFGLLPYRHAGPFVMFDETGSATAYRADEVRKLGPGTSKEDHRISTADQDGNAYLNKLEALGSGGWPGA